MNMHFDRQLLSEFDRIKDKDEQILWAAKPKFFPLLFPFLPMGIVFVLGVIFQTCFGFKLYTGVSRLFFDILIILLPLLFFFLMHVLYSKQLYGFSNKRVLIRYGFIKPYFKTIEYDEIIESKVKVNILDKIFHVGAIAFFTGEMREEKGKKEKVYYYWRAIENPDEIFKQISGYIQKHKQSEPIQ